MAMAQSTPGRPIATTTGSRRTSLDAVLAHAWDAAEFTATDAMATTGLTRSTAIEAMQTLTRLGLLRELPNAREAGDYLKGRPARRFELRAEAGVVVGVDAGRAHLTAIVADLRGKTLATAHTLSGLVHETEQENSPGEPEVRRRAVAEVIDEALGRARRPRSDIIALCAGVPAPVDANGASPPHPTGFWQRVNPDLVTLLREWSPIVRIDNDASLAAVAERAVGAAQGLDDIVVLLAGERLGAGVVVDGNVLRGAHGGAGEPVAFDHVQGVGSAHGIGYLIATWARESAGDLDPGHPIRAGLPEIDAPAVFDLARTGDEWALGLVDRAGAMLARIVSTFGN
ncbi:MAG: ROK family protein, partial [Microbacterium sp.]